jgi:hypothetical protein
MRHTSTRLRSATFQRAKTSARAARSSSLRRRRFHWRLVGGGLGSANIIITVPPRVCDVVMFESLVMSDLYIEVRESRF